MAPILYQCLGSPACASVLLTTKALGLVLKMKDVDLDKGEHLTPEFLKLNPQHSVPTLVDEDGFTIWDSHAINAYLVGKYGKDDSLYPKDLHKRAIVDQRLHFENGTISPRLASAFQTLFSSDKKMPDETKKQVKEIYSFLEKFLEGNEYVAGDKLTIADFSIVTTITALAILAPISEDEYPLIDKWLKKLKLLPYYEEANQKGIDAMTDFVKQKLQEK